MPSGHVLPSRAVRALRAHIVQRSGLRALSGRDVPATIATRRSVVYKGFDIILDHLSRISQPCTIPPALCSVLYLVAMRMEC